MPLEPHAPLPRRVHPLLATVACTAVAAWFTGCATERLGSTAPQGVDLSGEWRINWNLSDDPQKLGDDRKDQGPGPTGPSGHGGHGGGGFGRPGGGIGGPGAGSLDPGGGDLTNNDAHQDTVTDGFQVAHDRGDRDNSPYAVAASAAPRAATTSGLLPVLYTAQADSALPGSSSDIAPPTASRKSDIRNAVARMLATPELLTISQSGPRLVVKANADTTPEQYTAGEAATIPFGTAGAERTSGWRDSVFVVITKARKGPSKEDDFTLDSEGHLIFATLVIHSGKGNIDFKRVYDRVRRHN